MKLFDPRTADVVALPLIYSPLPVDFSLRLELDEHGEIQTPGGAVEGRRERGEREAREVWEEALVRPHRAHSSRGRRCRISRPGRGAWADLRADENGRCPLRTQASDWARQQRTDRRGSRETETLHSQAEAEHAALVQHRFVLIGDPGSGKSTFLRHLALSWAAGRLREMGQDADPPDSGAVPGPEPGDALARPAGHPHLHRAAAAGGDLCAAAGGRGPADMPGLAILESLPARPIGRHAVRGCLRRPDRFAGGRPLSAILLDGLDEVGDADDHRRRRQVQRFVERVARAFARRRSWSPPAPTPIAWTIRADPARWELRGFGYTALVPLEPERQQAMAQRLFTCLRPGDRGRAGRVHCGAVQRAPGPARQPLAAHAAGGRFLAPACARSARPAQDAAASCTTTP